MSANNSTPEQEAAALAWERDPQCAAAQELEKYRTPDDGDCDGACMRILATAYRAQVAELDRLMMSQHSIKDGIRKLRNNARDGVAYWRAWALQAESQLASERARAQLMQDHYECKMADSERFSRIEQQLAQARELMDRMAVEMHEADHEFASLRDYDAQQAAQQRGKEGAK